ncbi:MAG: DUF2784 domain-containing protein [Nitrospiraceae bacterium]
MLYGLLADFVVFLHLAFVLFVVFGGLLVLRRPRIIWLHLPAAIWGAIMEFGGWICPLTPLEVWLRTKAGEEGYQGDFLEHYLMPVLYPSPLTRNIQLALGLAVVIVNLVVYGWLWRQLSRQSGRTLRSF